jgi:hypothetical protein
MSKELFEKFGITEEITADNLAEVESRLIDSVKSRILEDESFYSTIDKSKLPQDWFKDQFNQGVSKISAMSNKQLISILGYLRKKKLNLLKMN